MCDKYQFESWPMEACNKHSMRNRNWSWINPQAKINVEAGKCWFRNAISNLKSFILPTCCHRIPCGSHDRRAEHKVLYGHCACERQELFVFLNTQDSFIDFINEREVSLFNILGWNTQETSSHIWSILSALQTSSGSYIDAESGTKESIS